MTKREANQQRSLQAFLAKKADYKKATVTIQRGGATPSRVWLPVVPVDQAAVTAR